MTEAGNNIHDRLVKDGKVMSLFEHLGELRERLIKTMIGLVVLFFIALYFSPHIIKYLERPLAVALKSTSNILHFTGPFDVFLTSIKISFLTAIVVGCPIWIYQFWKFIEPALYESERRYVMPFILASIGLFVFGIGSCFFLVMPITLDFLITMGKEVGTPIITVTDYTSLMTLMLFGFGLVFEAPLILVLLGSLEVIDAKTLSSHRRGVCVGAFIIGAILTPSPDPISQCFMAIPLYVMYEIAIVIIRRLERRRDAGKPPAGSPLATT